MSEYLRLGLGGLLLQQEVFRQQREASNGLQRGFVLVLLVGLLVGVASMIGAITQMLVSPDGEVVVETVHDGLTGMPWYQNLASSSPDGSFEQQFEQIFDQVTQIVTLLDTSGVTDGLVSLFLSPIALLIIWLVAGLLAHLIARMLGGSGTLPQTLGCMALASGANLLAVVKIVPFAQVSGATLLALIASYLAVREAHALSPRRAFWAIAAAPLLLLVVAVSGSCVVLMSLM